MFRRLSVFLVGAVMVLTGCAKPPAPSPSPSSSAPVLADRLVALRDTGVSLGSLRVTHSQDEDKTSAYVVRDGVTHYVGLAAHPTGPWEMDTSRVATIPWSVADPSSIAAQIDRLSAVCPDAYTADVEAVTATALLSTVTCPSRGSGSSGALLNGEPLSTFDGRWTAQDWQRLLDEWAILAKSGTLTSAQIDSDKIWVRLASVEATHNCNPRILRSLDGLDVSLLCFNYKVDPPFSFAGLTGEQLATAAGKAMAEAGIKAGTEVEYALSNSGGGVRLDVRQGRKSASQILKP